MINMFVDGLVSLLKFHGIQHSWKIHDERLHKDSNLQTELKIHLPMARREDKDYGIEC